MNGDEFKKRNEILTERVKAITAFQKAVSDYDIMMSSLIKRARKLQKTCSHKNEVGGICQTCSLESLGLTKVFPKIDWR